MALKIGHVVFAVALLALGCAEDDPVPTAMEAGAPADASQDAGAPSADGSDGATTAGCQGPGTAREAPLACQPQATDYQPRTSASAADMWPACVSDDDRYHQIEQTVSSVARVAAFEEMAPLLWNKPTTPTPEDFIAARVIYARDQGLDSRVQRREDVHYPAPTGTATCRDPGVPAQHPDRCVGPAKLLPILNDAFEKGARAETPAVHAARIEAALLWFLYVSALSEVETCAMKPADCDSCWAYYTGGTPRESPASLGRYIKALDPQTHDRAFDGVLAVRCWRNLDNELGAAMNADLRGRAREQLDRALLRGMALVVRDRLDRRTCDTVEARGARAAFLSTMGGLLDRAARERNPVETDRLKAALAAPDDMASVDGGVQAIDRLFPCP